MMKISIIAVGKIKEKYFSDAINEYSKRLGAYCKFSINEINEYKCPDNPSQADIRATVENEGSRILAAIPQGATVIPMCIEGKEKSSEQLAEFISNAAVNGISNICFIIGGSWGLDERVKAAGSLRLSISPMTLPHTLARVVLSEQIYRAFTIINRTKYHK